MTIINATDIVKSIQEALDTLAQRSCDKLHKGFYTEHAPYCHPCLANKALSLIPSLLTELERVEKGVSLEDIALQVGKEIGTIPFSEAVKITKTVFDKAKVKYHD